MLKPRLIAADLLRIIASLAILTIHVMAFSYDNLPLVGYYNWLFGSSILWSLLWGSGTFLMMSGYFLLNSSEGNALEFYRKRSSKLLIPFLFWNMFYYIFNHREQFASINFIDFVSNLFNSGTHYHLYFLNVIIGLYLITPLLRLFIVKVNLNIITPILLTLSSFYLYAYCFLGFPKANNILVWFLPYIGYYLAGYWLGSKKPINKPITLLLISGCIMLINTFIARKVQFIFSGYDQANIITNRLSPLVIVASLLIFRGIMSLNNVKLARLKRFSFLSNFSFGIYLVHPFWIEINKTLPITNYLASNYYLPWLFVSLFMVTVLSIATVKVLRSIPVIRNLV